MLRLPPIIRRKVTSTEVSCTDIAQSIDCRPVHLSRIEKARQPTLQVFVADHQLFLNLLSPL
jgi:hypothetical protein